jgi:hypothetical protein
MQTDEAAALLPTTYKLVIGDRTVNYCLYGPEDGLPVISHSGTPSTRWKRPAIVAAVIQAAEAAAGSVAGVIHAHARPRLAGLTRPTQRRHAARLSR